MGTHVSVADGPVNKRPISDWVSAQGTYCMPNPDNSPGCFLFVPPVQNFFAWTDPFKNLSVSVDYAGLVDRYLVSIGAIRFGTTFDGQVTERPLPDGRAEVTVSLHTQNALTWVIAGDGQGNYDYANAPTLFGARINEGFGAPFALGDCSMQVKFINSAVGAPLPDLEQLVSNPGPGQEFPSFVTFRSREDGLLRSAFGVPDGTPGRVECTQTGLLTKEMGRPGQDGFPVEHIIVSAIGE
jgi:hypothetical protein